jgi:hypothetical protein
MPRLLARNLARLRYGYEMVQAYLASMCNDYDYMNTHLAEADKAWLRWWKEGM